MGEFVHREDNGAVVVARIDRPKVNALSMGLLDELRALVDSLRADPPGALVLTGSERIFSAGADVAEFGGSERAGEVADAFRAVAGALAALPRVTIAAIAGAAFGGGLELALACDLRVAERGARLGQPEIHLGIVPGGGATQRLTRLVGVSRAKAMILGGEPVSAEEALQIGLVDRLAEPGHGRDEALEWAHRLAGGALVAQGLAKAVIDAGLDRTLEEGLDLERQAFVDVARTNDAAIGLASFREQGPGKARFTGS